LHDIFKLTGKLTGIFVKEIPLTEPFIDFAGRFADIPGTVVLMSGGNLDCSRFHILATAPWLSFSGRHDNLTLEANGKNIHLKENPFTVLRTVINAFSDSLGLDHTQTPLPISCGLFGYLSYDLKDCLETLPRTSVDRLGLPHILLFAPSILVVHDKLKNVTRLCIPERKLNHHNTLDHDRDNFYKLLSAQTRPLAHFQGDAARLTSNFAKQNYIRTINRIKEYIASGHVYQVNMSQRFETEFSGNTYGLFRALYEMNPAPFFAFINAGDHHIVSTSPERFLLQTGNQVETRPIKGTRPRGKTREEDHQLREELVQSKKDDAELSMIVDLLRNDIGKVCSAKSVHVAEHKRVEAYQNVYHLVSVVKGTLDDPYDSIDLIQATFPGGSITGCPKIRAMEIIDELEPERRHIYTGSIGYISFHDTMDLSIAIRTATIYNGKIIFSVGGGIVFDSNPEDEFDETLHKGRTLTEVFKGEAGTGNRQDWVWINGALAPLTQANISITDLGFQYGYGFFETIRANKGEPKRLSAHIQRFEKTWKYFFPDAPPDLTWCEIIRQVLVKNRLVETPAAVKIIATKGSSDIPPYNHNLVVTARPYVHRLKEKKEPGLTLAVYPHPRQTPLADYKTLNYLYYHQAAGWAADKGADEALILNPDGTLSETNTASILLIKGKTVVKPVSPHVLAGTMEKTICELLIMWGYTVKKKEVRSEDLFLCDDVLITNALIGAVPILEIDGKRLKAPSNLWKKINQEVL